MQLRNGKSTSGSYRCTAQRASNRKMPRSSLDIVCDELQCMFDEIDIKYTTAYQYMYGIGEIYDYIAEHLDVIRTHNKIFTALRVNTIRLISDDIPNTILQKGNDIDILDAINTLFPKLFTVLAKMGPDTSE